MELMGHRGAKGEYPENTMGGFKYAVDQGIKSIEFDVHLTKDAKAVVIHDDTLERTTNGTGRVLDHTLEQLQKLDAGKGEKIPSLHEVLLFMQQHQIKCQIEVKAANLEQIIVEQVNALKIKDSATIISFNHRFLKKVKDLDSDMRVYPLIYGLPLDPIHIMQTVEAEGISLSAQTVDKAFIDQCHTRGKLVTVWNANSSQELQRVKELGADFVGTDVPSQLI